MASSDRTPRWQMASSTCAMRTHSSASIFGSNRKYVGDALRRYVGHVLWTCLTIVPLAITLTAQQRTPSPREALDRAIDDFLAGRIAESVVGFDQVVKLAPEAAPQLWRSEEHTSELQSLRQ